jgi:hypothetical protein
VDVEIWGRRDKANCEDSPFIHRNIECTLNSWLFKHRKSEQRDNVYFAFLASSSDSRRATSAVRS